MEARVLPAAFATATVVWVLLLGLAPVAAAQGHASYIYGFAAMVYGACAFLCHQLPGRSFHLGSTQLPVCARCTGIYAGAAAAAILDTLVPRLPITPSRLTLLAAAFPTLVTVIDEWITGGVTSNWIRFAAGVPLGAGVAILVIASLCAVGVSSRAADVGSDQLN